jgi:hypothetical protein
MANSPLPSTSQVRKRIDCNSCGSSRQHLSQAVFWAQGEEGERDDDGHPAHFDVYEILQCLGCGAVTVQHCWWKGGKYYEDPESGDIAFPDEHCEFFPPRQTRTRPAWLSELPERLKPVLTEVYLALDAGAPILAAIGVRTVLDGVMTKVVGDIGTFKAKLDALETKGWITALDKRRLAIVVDAGNAAAHRGFKAGPNETNRMMDTLEHLLHARFVLDKQAKQLKRVTPKRSKKRKSQNSD